LTEIDKLPENQCANHNSTKHNKAKADVRIQPNESSPIKYYRTKCSTSANNHKNILHINNIYNANGLFSNDKFKNERNINTFNTNNIEENPRNYSNYSFKSFSKVLIDNIIESREKIIDKKKSLNEQISEFFIDFK
jgi:hypothetical protein